jgi:hypothetical protein
MGGQLVEKIAFLNKLHCVTLFQSKMRAIYHPLADRWTAPREPSSTGIDAALPANEPLQWLGLVRDGVTLVARDCGTGTLEADDGFTVPGAGYAGD